ncbi:MAG TPA: malate dehydrogenase [Thermodesulfatator sp.]|nr:malate dehydrogenase [Thermodesulfatator sp.]
MAKITIVGAGAVGTSAAIWSFVKRLADIVLIDVVEGLARGKALDLAQASPIWGYQGKIVGTEDWAASEGSQVVIITAGRPRKPGMSREDLLKVNLEIVKSCVENTIKYAPEACYIVITNPIDAMVYTAYKVSGLPKERVIGMAGVLDSARYRYFLAQALGVAPADVQALVMGIHGDHMLPLTRLANVNGVPVKELLSSQELDQIVDRTRHGGAEIVGHLKTGSAFITPGLSAIEMAEAIVCDQKRLLPCAAYLEGEFGLEGCFLGVPVILGRNGVERIVEFPLSEEEKEALRASFEAVKRQIEATGL